MKMFREPEEFENASVIELASHLEESTNALNGSCLPNHKEELINEKRKKMCDEIRAYIEKLKYYMDKKNNS